MVQLPAGLLAGKSALVVGIANENSIAYGCAKAFRALGAELAVTYLNEKAKPHVAPLAEALGAPVIMPLDVRSEDQLDELFAAVKAHWGGLDVLVHSIAYAPKADLHGRLVDSTRDGFLEAIDVSCHSFVRMARLADGLFCIEDRWLLVVAHQPMAAGGTQWLVYPVDSAADKIAPPIELPTRAAEIVFVPGKRRWAVLEKGPMRQVGVQPLQQLITFPRPALGPFESPR